MLFWCTGRRRHGKYIVETVCMNQMHSRALCLRARGGLAVENNVDMSGHSTPPPCSINGRHRDCDQSCGTGLSYHLLHVASQLLKTGCSAPNCMNGVPPVLPAARRVRGTCPTLHCTYIRVDMDAACSMCTFVVEPLPVCNKHPNDQLLHPQCECIRPPTPVDHQRDRTAAHHGHQGSLQRAYCNEWVRLPQAN